jgi:hypothetical protein
MDYRVFSTSSGEEENSTEAHVFARAYHWAWRSIHGCEPTGRHQIDGLEFVIDFGEPAATRTGPSHAGAAPAAPRVESASALADGPSGGRHDN